MPRPMDDLPFRAMRELCVVVDEEMAERLAAHVEEYHLPEPRREGVTAVAWVKQRIPDVELAQMVEVMEAQGASVHEVAARFDRPLTLVERELAAYRRRYLRWVEKYAWLSG